MSYKEIKSSNSKPKSLGSQPLPSVVYDTKTTQVINPNYPPVVASNFTVINNENAPISLKTVQFSVKGPVANQGVKISCPGAVPSITTINNLDITTYTLTFPNPVTINPGKFCTMQLQTQTGPTGILYPAQNVTATLSNNPNPIPVPLVGACPVNDPSCADPTAGKVTAITVDSVAVAGTSFSADNLPARLSNMVAIQNLATFSPTNGGISYFSLAQANFMIPEFLKAQWRSSWMNGYLTFGGTTNAPADFIALANNPTALSTFVSQILPFQKNAEYEGISFDLAGMDNTQIDALNTILTKIRSVCGNQIKILAKIPPVASIITTYNPAQLTQLCANVDYVGTTMLHYNGGGPWAAGRPAGAIVPFENTNDAGFNPEYTAKALINALNTTFQNIPQAKGKIILGFPNNGNSVIVPKGQYGFNASADGVDTMATDCNPNHPGPLCATPLAADASNSTNAIPQAVTKNDIFSSKSTNTMASFPNNQLINETFTYAKSMLGNLLAGSDISIYINGDSNLARADGLIAAACDALAVNGSCTAQASSSSSSSSSTASFLPSSSSAPVSSSSSAPVSSSSVPVSSSSAPVSSSSSSAPESSSSVIASSSSVPVPSSSSHWLSSSSSSLAPLSSSSSAMNQTNNTDSSTGEMSFSSSMPWLFSSSSAENNATNNSTAAAEAATLPWVYNDEYGRYGFMSFGALMVIVNGGVLIKNRDKICTYLMSAFAAAIPGGIAALLWWFKESDSFNTVFAPAHEVSDEEWISEIATIVGAACSVWGLTALAFFYGVFKPCFHKDNSPKEVDETSLIVKTHRTWDRDSTPSISANGNSSNYGTLSRSKAYPTQPLPSVKNSTNATSDSEHTIVPIDNRHANHGSFSSIVPESLKKSTQMADENKKDLSAENDNSAQSDEYSLLAPEQKDEVIQTAFDEMKLLSTKGYGITLTPARWLDEKSIDNQFLKYHELNARVRKLKEIYEIAAEINTKVQQTKGKTLRTRADILTITNKQIQALERTIPQRGNSNNKPNKTYGSTTENGLNAARQSLLNQFKTHQGWADDTKVLETTAQYYRAILLLAKSGETNASHAAVAKDLFEQFAQWKKTYRPQSSQRLSVPQEAIVSQSATSQTIVFGGHLALHNINEMEKAMKKVCGYPVETPRNHSSSGITLTGNNLPRPAEQYQGMGGKPKLTSNQKETLLSLSKGASLSSVIGASSSTDKIDSSSVTIEIKEDARNSLSTTALINQTRTGQSFISAGSNSFAQNVTTSTPLLTSGSGSDEDVDPDEYADVNDARVASPPTP